MDPFVGEIRAVGFNYAPQGWAFCQGQLLPITQNAALYSLIGITYGGDGRTTFGLPDLRGRLIVQPGQGVGLSSYQLGQKSGTETVTLLATQLPAHTHALSPNMTVGANGGAGNTTTPAGNALANSTVAQYSSSSDIQMAANMLTGTTTSAGDGGAHNNLMPFLALNYIIALQGIFPPRP